ncbi:hypothetical protein [Cellulosimicrobium arenosum]|uniref:DUF559 domain-containing protein n=1 Tax=Cellulosimicrobium arenosum TaxID=2708133 RepID=A0A927G7H5_9MICO|nr:hypothetical protein [Cellulosimicrobium arenosum]MBD8078317.1 hypothetical protein [Cellulosimicrobium arenosum]
MTAVQPTSRSFPSAPRRPGDSHPTERPLLPAPVRFSEERRTELARRTALGALERVRRGIYLPRAATDLGRAAARREDVLRQVVAVAERLSTPYWFSHTSAALLHGCWTWHLPRDVHLTQLRAPKGAQVAEQHLHRHWTALPARDRSEVAGLPVTGLERTVVDCARAGTGPQGLVVADSALRAGADPTVLTAILDESVGKRGIRRARTVVALADARAESPGESVVRWTIHEAGLPAPVPAHEATTARGRYWLDLAWPDLMVAIEFDGAVKYSGGEFGDPSARIWREKLRHDALTEAGWLVVRVVWADLTAPESLERRLRAALRQHR